MRKLTSGAIPFNRTGFSSYVKEGKRSACRSFFVACGLALALLTPFTAHMVAAATIDTLPIGPVDGQLAAVGALVHGGTFVADVPYLVEITLAFFAADGAVGRPVVLATDGGVPVGAPLWHGPEIRAPVDAPLRSDAQFELTFQPNLLLTPGARYFVGIDFGAFGPGTPGLMFFVGAAQGNPIPDGRAWGYVVGSGWTTLGSPDTDLAVRLVMTAAPGQTGPGIIYSNFGGGMAFDTDIFHGWTINGFLGSGGGAQGVANRFTPGADALFASAQVPLTLFSGPAAVTVLLQADSNGLPGPVLEEIDVTGPTGVPTVLTATSLLRPKLKAGSPYWLTLVAAAPGVIAGWNWNSIGESSTRVNFAVTQGGTSTGLWATGPFATRGAFEIKGSARVPDAAVHALITRIGALVQTGALRQDAADGLIHKLQAVVARLERGKTTSACNQLRAFINQTRGLVRAGALAPGEAESLMSSAEDIRMQVGC